MSKQLNKLASLVAAEKDELATLTASEATSNDSIESFVDAVFDGITPAEQYRPEVSAPRTRLRARRRSRTCPRLPRPRSPSARGPAELARPVQGRRQDREWDAARFEDGQRPLAAEAMRADEEAEERTAARHANSPTLAARGGRPPRRTPLAGEDDDVFAMLSSLDVPPAVHASYPSASHYLPLELPPPCELFTTQPSWRSIPSTSHRTISNTAPIQFCRLRITRPHRILPLTTTRPLQRSGGAPPAHGAPPRNDYPLSPTAADSLAKANSTSPSARSR